MPVRTIWVVAELSDGEPTGTALELLAGARRLAASVDAVTWGANERAAQVLGLHGAARVLDVAGVGDALPAAVVASALAGEISRKGAPDAVLLAQTYDGRDIAGRLSAALDRPVLTNAVDLVEEGGSLVSSHAVFGGNQIVTARFTGPGPAIFVVRAKSFEAAAVNGAPAGLVRIEAGDLGRAGAARVLRRHVEERSGPSLEDASVVVSGGRGLGQAEGYAMVEELARLLHGAPGASRAIVDAGWVPYAYQVGQTGKTVKPDVYIACGISGATQHMVGMKGSKRIIAINKDRDAPIFQIADLGIVGDVRQVVPRLIEAIKARG